MMNRFRDWVFNKWVWDYRKEVKNEWGVEYLFDCSAWKRWRLYLV